MALFKFKKAILNGDPTDVCNRGEMSRDFTYISDIVEAIQRLISNAPNQISAANYACDSLSPGALSRVINIGNSKPIKINQFIYAIETTLGQKAILNYLPMQAGDVKATLADTNFLWEITGYDDKTGINEGIMHCVHWYLN